MLLNQAKFKKRKEKGIGDLDRAMGPHDRKQYFGFIDERCGDYLDDILKPPPRTSVEFVQNRWHGVFENYESSAILQQKLETRHAIAHLPSFEVLL